MLRPEKMSRTSTKPPATDRKEQRAQSKPGGAKPSHEGHSRVMCDDPDTLIEHRPRRAYAAVAAYTSHIRHRSLASPSRSSCPLWR